MVKIDRRKRYDRLDLQVLFYIIGMSWGRNPKDFCQYGSLFDANQTMVAKIADGLYQVQVVAWYDNENSYTSQMVRTIKYFAELK